MDAAATGSIDTTMDAAQTSGQLPSIHLLAAPTLIDETIRHSPYFA
jgi:hypothetical protein